MSSFFQNIIIIGGLLIIVSLGYYMYTKNAEDTDSQSVVSAQVAAESADFLRRLNEIKTIELNGDIFSDPRFVSLVNYSVPVFSEPVGRTNPFEVTN